MQTAPVMKPKRPRTAYNLFFRDQQAKLNITKPQFAKASNTASKISESWKSMLPSERAMYFQKAAEDKFRYYSDKREYDDYLASIGEKSATNPTRAKKKTANTKKLHRNKSKNTASTATSLRDASPTAARRLLLAEEAPRPRALLLPERPTLLVPSGMLHEPSYSPQAIAILASKLDPQSINFLIKAFK